VSLTAPADRCPVCGTERNAPPVGPLRTREYPGSVTAYYRCPERDCRASWWVSWDAASLGEAAA
jgi:hypothetical protein